jgi:hypothetical protein
MTTRRLTRGVISAARAGQHERVEHFDRLLPGDEFKAHGRRGWYRFTAAVLRPGTDEVDHIEAVGPLTNRPGAKATVPPLVRAIATADVIVPGQRMLNNRRRQRVA